MELRIKTFEGMPCEIEEFTINGNDATELDFGMNQRCSDFDSCHNTFLPIIIPRPSVLDRYGINRDEYRNVYRALERKLFCHDCTLCFKKNGNNSNN